MRSQSNVAEHDPAESGVHYLKIAAVLSGVLLVQYVKFGDTLLVEQLLVLRDAAVFKIRNRDVVKKKINRHDYSTFYVLKINVLWRNIGAQRSLRS